VLGALLASSLTLAQTNKNSTVYFNGTPIKGRLVTVNGKPFIQLPISDLQKAGVLLVDSSAPVEAIQGCLSQPLFNGVVRMTLISAGFNKHNKYEISFRATNGTQ